MVPLSPEEYDRLEQRMEAEEHRRWLRDLADVSERIRLGRPVTPEERAWFERDGKAS